ncbi:CLUMA_CG002380, isoform A [Clunio marinus]|uniref:CLUMA_CG002380, isoform A n=1 Tax=Clunio marinus TaxID=568069 RepID=A0A1J1HL74_9DIPT|nr:CLUMA_CG002380, isoform A [Clunio marinus]
MNPDSPTSSDSSDYAERILKDLRQRNKNKGTSFFRNITNLPTSSRTNDPIPSGQKKIEEILSAQIDVEESSDTEKERILKEFRKKNKIPGRFFLNLRKNSNHDDALPNKSVSDSEVPKSHVEKTLSDGQKSDDNITFRKPLNKSQKKKSKVSQPSGVASDSKENSSPLEFNPTPENSSTPVQVRKRKTSCIDDKNEESKKQNRNQSSEGSMSMDIEQITRDSNNSRKSPVENLTVKKSCDISISLVPPKVASLGELQAKLEECESDDKISQTPQVSSSSSSLKRAKKINDDCSVPKKTKRLQQQAAVKAPTRVATPDTVKSVPRKMGQPKILNTIASNSEDESLHSTPNKKQKHSNSSDMQSSKAQSQDSHEVEEISTENENPEAQEHLSDNSLSIQPDNESHHNLSGSKKDDIDGESRQLELISEETESLSEDEVEASETFDPTNTKKSNNLQISSSEDEEDDRIEMDSGITDGFLYDPNETGTHGYKLRVRRLARAWWDHSTDQPHYYRCKIPKVKRLEREQEAMKNLKKAHMSSTSFKKLKGSDSVDDLKFNIVDDGVSHACINDISYYLRINANKFKSEAQINENCSMSLFLLKSEVNLHVNGELLKLKPFQHFFLKSGDTYAIHNVSNETAVISVNVSGGL